MVLSSSCVETMNALDADAHRMIGVMFAGSFMIKKLICYFVGHAPNFGNPYKTFVDSDGLMKVLIAKSYQCTRCNKELIRQTEPHEWSRINTGQAVVRD